MDIIEVGKFTVSPFELERILELKMEKKMNDHAMMYIRGVLKDGEKDSAVAAVSEETQIQCQVDGKTIFSGIIQNINVTCTDTVYYLEASVVSNTILLDVCPMQRSFQEKDQEFKAIADYVIKDAGAKMQFHAPAKKVENIILQYNETDWDFMKRLASHSNSVLIPVANSEQPEFLFGVEDAMEYKDKLDAFHYSISKDMAMYRSLSQSEDLDFTEDDAIIYSLKTDDFVFDIGDMLSLNGNPLFVSTANLLLKDSILVCTYTLATKNAISCLKYITKI